MKNIDHWGYQRHKCPGCGAATLPGQRYCQECGERLKMCGECKRAFPNEGSLLCLVEGKNVKPESSACAYWEEKM